MIFHSFDFLAFFLVVVTIYWRLPHRAQNALLLVASYVFYGWVHPWFVAIMLVSTTVDFWATRRMEDDPARKTWYLGASLTAAFEVVWAGVFAFGIQIYADFAAYSDIARGTARWFGFSLIQNFNHPYIAHSPADFWRRWHISLSTWFRDYVYIPLGGNRVPQLQREMNLLATFLVSGLWHGPSWNYVLWGLYHGLLVVISSTLGRWLRLPERWPGPLALVQIALTVSLAMAGWLFFRETDPEYLRRFLLLSPADSTPDERLLGLYLVAMTATWAVPLFVDDLWALARERQPRLADWVVDRATRPGFRRCSAGRRRCPRHPHSRFAESRIVGFHLFPVLNTEFGLRLGA